MQSLNQLFQQNLTNVPIVAILISFLSGIMASLTPCVYPIIPIIVTYVGGQSDGSKTKAFFISLFYVLGLAVVYSILGAVAGLTGSFFGQIQASFWANFIVGNICLILALSMFDLFTIQIPFLSFLQSKQSSSTKRRGILGAFLFGAITGLVASPCTAPVLGGILTFVATKQNVFYGFILLFAFALGMGLPLIILGTFAGLLTSLPKSGKWTLIIKKFFAFVLLGIAEYFFVQAGRFY